MQCEAGLSVKQMREAFSPNEPLLRPAGGRYGDGRCRSDAAGATER